MTTMMIQNIIAASHDAAIHCVARVAWRQRPHPKAPTPFVR
tara:strand:- start:164 stop:286 length:123 start_codon:yes stop_codon:yes gene_type:complete